MQFLAFLKPTSIRILIVLTFAAYFLAINTTGFNQGDREPGTVTENNDLTVVGYPYGYLTASPKGGTQFHARALIKNLAYYYVLACLLAALVTYTVNTYRFGEHKQKVILSGAFFNGIIGFYVLVTVFGGQWINRAATREDRTTIKFLLNLGVPPDALSSDATLSPLIVAAKKNNAEMARLFLSLDPHVINKTNRDGQSALHFASMHNSMAVAKVLIKAGAKVNLQDHTNSLPIHFIRSYEMAEFLIENKSDLDHKNERGLTPAFSAHDGKTLELFRAKGAFLSLTSSDSHVLLEHTDNPNIILMAINAGGNVNSRNTSRETPLHRLVKLSNKEDPKIYTAMQSLVKRGANVDMRDRHGLSPIHYAIQQCDIAAGKIFIKSSREVRKQLESKQWDDPLKSLIADKKDCWNKIRVEASLAKKSDLPEDEDEEEIAPAGKTPRVPPKIKTSKPKVNTAQPASIAPNVKTPENAPQPKPASSQSQGGGPAADVQVSPAETKPNPPSDALVPEALLPESTPNEEPKNVPELIPDDKDSKP